MITERNRFGQYYTTINNSNVGWTEMRGGRTMEQAQVNQNAGMTIEEVRAICRDLARFYTIDVYPNNAALKACLTRESKVILPDILTKITATAFKGHTEITSIYIPRSVVSIEVGALAECQNLTEIIVDRANPKFSSRDGILYNKEGNSLVFYPRMKSWDTFNIPDDVESIQPFAFAYAENLVKINLPMLIEKVNAQAFANCVNVQEIFVSPNVTRIEERAFHNCANLRIVNIPDTVTYIGTEAFYRCGAMKSVFIPESVVEMGAHPFSLCTKNLIVMCESAKPGDKWAQDWASLDGFGGKSFKVQYKKSRK